MEHEVWKTIEKFPDYAVSNLGRVRRITFSPYARKTSFLKPIRTQYGYMQVCLFRDKKRNIRFVHRLVLEAFVKQPSKRHNTNHINGNKEDNCLENLEWVTQKENIHHSLHVLGRRTAKGEQLPQAKLTKYDIRRIRRLYTAGKYTQKQLGEMFGVDTSNISYIVNRKRWNHVP